ncbi:MAG TPA: hypothetical protein VF884_03460 [Nitrososphaeraceae archaeon]
MVLYGISGNHATEACPLNNQDNRALMLEISQRLAEVAQRNHIELKEQFHSALEHNFLWILDAQNGHVVQKFMIELGMAKFNSMKIFPIGTFQNVVDECRRLEQLSKPNGS